MAELRLRRKRKMSLMGLFLLLIGNRRNAFMALLVLVLLVISAMVVLPETVLVKVPMMSRFMTQTEEGLFGSKSMLWGGQFAGYLFRFREFLGVSYGAGRNAVAEGGTSRAMARAADAGQGEEARYSLSDESGEDGFGSGGSRFAFRRKPFSGAGAGGRSRAGGAERGAAGYGGADAVSALPLDSGTDAYARTGAVLAAMKSAGIMAARAGTLTAGAGLAAPAALSAAAGSDLSGSRAGGRGGASGDGGDFYGDGADEFASGQGRAAAKSAARRGAAVKGVAGAGLSGGEADTFAYVSNSGGAGADLAVRIHGSVAGVSGTAQAAAQGEVMDLSAQARMYGRGLSGGRPLRGGALADAISSVDLVTGGATAIEVGMLPPGTIRGAVTPQERKSGNGADGVSVADMLSGQRGGGMIAGMSNRPYLGRYPGTGKDSVSVLAGMDMVEGAFSSKASKLPGEPSASYSDVKTGKISSFAWDKVSVAMHMGSQYALYKTKEAVRQLSSAFSMASVAFGNIAYETKASFSGAPYDGNTVNSGLLSVSYQQMLPSVSNRAVTTMISGARQLEDAEFKCISAQTAYGKAWSSDGLLMERIATTMGSPPRCCDHGAVERWNQRVYALVLLCIKLNTNGRLMASACQSYNQQVDCNQYARMHIDPCSVILCLLSVILGVALVVASVAVMGLGAALLGGALAAGGALLLSSGLVDSSGVYLPLGFSASAATGLAGSLIAFFTAGLGAAGVTAAFTAIAINKSSGLPSVGIRGGGTRDDVVSSAYDGEYSGGVIPSNYSSSGELPEGDGRPPGEAGDIIGAGGKPADAGNSPGSQNPDKP
ncbi:MAG: hypothetical protein WC421_03935 [Elusimicrobiales bacterium]